MSVLKRWLGKSTKSSRKAVASARRPAMKLAVESLEQREVPAGISYNPFTHFLTVTGGAGNDAIAITRTGSTVKATLNGMSQSFLLGGTGVHDIFVNPGAGQNSVQVIGMSNFVPVNITGGIGGNDSIWVDLPASNPALATGFVNVSYGPGSKATLDVSDYSDSLGRYVTITSSAVTMQPPTGPFGLPGPTDATVKYTGNITSLEVDGGNSNSFMVLSTKATTPLSIYAGTGFNQVNIGGGGTSLYSNPNGSLAAVASPVHVYDYCGKTNLNIDDSKGSDNQHVTVTDKSVSFAGGPTVYYQGNSPIAGNGVTDLSIFAPDDFTDHSVFTVQSLASNTTLDLWGNWHYTVNGPAAGKAHLHHYGWLT
jgi:hypothetical protein